MTNRNHKKNTAEKTVRHIRRATRRRYSAEEKIRIVFEGLYVAKLVVIVPVNQPPFLEPVFVPQLGDQDFS